MASSPQQDAFRLFQAEFKHRPTHAAAAPARVNLIGEHVDYNAGFVMPLALDRCTCVFGRVVPQAPNSTAAHFKLVTALPAGVARADFVADQALAPGKPSWANYVKGVCAQVIRAGFVLPSLEIAIVTDVPIGAGLSSSAALEVAILTLLQQVVPGLDALDGVRKALMCQAAEHEFAGVPCGIMDQFISALGVKDSCLLIDCRTHQTEVVPLSDPNVVILVINSNVHHQLADGAYAKRVAECKEALAAITSAFPDQNIAALRDASREQLEQVKEKISPTVYRRALHVITEIARTLDAKAALKENDYDRVGEYMAGSHASLRDDYEVSCAELDQLVHLANDCEGVYGSRMTGGGFGGSTVTLVRKDKAEQVQRHILSEYTRLLGLTASAFVSIPSAGAHAIDVAAIAASCPEPATLPSVPEVRKRAPTQPLYVRLAAAFGVGVPLVLLFRYFGFPLMRRLSK